MWMWIDIKDITDILPFILDNLPVTAYIIIVSIILGFGGGKIFEQIRQKNKIFKLNSDLANKEETITKINAEKEQLEKEIQQISTNYEILRNRTEIIKNGQTNSNFTSLSALERMLDSTEGKMELTALIELKYKKSKEEQNEN